MATTDEVHMAQFDLMSAALQYYHDENLSHLDALAEAAQAYGEAIRKLVTEDDLGQEIDEMFEDE